MPENKYTDEDLIIATQIAYMDFTKESFDELRRAGKPPTISNLLEENPDILKDLEDKLAKIPEDEQDGLKATRYKESIDLIAQLQDNKNGWGDWVIVDIEDKNNASGFYACTIDTGGGNAIVGFRGSESNNLAQFHKDWVQADFGLLNSTLTAQQLDAQNYMLKVEGLVAQHGYTSLALTGHSLGGNLAAHATITAPASLQDLIKQSVSFDGPGFSDEYLRANAAGIAKMGGMMRHYQWSLVGALLFQVPGSTDITIETGLGTNGSIDPQKHDTAFARSALDENGMIVAGSRDFLSNILYYLSKAIELVPLGNNTLNILIGAVDLLMYVVRGVAWLLDKGKELVKAIGNGISSIFAAVTDFGTKVYNASIGAVKAGWLLLKQQLNSAAKFIKESAAKLANFFTELAASIKNRAAIIWEGITAGIQSAGAWLGEMKKEVTLNLEKTHTALKKGLNKAMRLVKDTSVKIVEQIGSAVKNGYERLKGGFKRARKGLTLIGESVTGHMIKEADELWISIQNTLSKAGGTVADAAKTIVDTAAQSASMLGDALEASKNWISQNALAAKGGTAEYSVGYFGGGTAGINYAASAQVCSWLVELANHVNADILPAFNTIFMDLTSLRYTSVNVGMFENARHMISRQEKMLENHHADIQRYIGQCQDVESGFKAKLAL